MAKHRRRICWFAQLLFLALRAPANAREEIASEIVVQADAGELPSAFGAPPDLSHGRISTLTKTYVLSPFTFELENSYAGSFFRHGAAAHAFTQEIEMGLPARVTVGVQNQFAHFNGKTSERSITLEGRYALANWNKIPLNPALSAEYRFGWNRRFDDSAELALLLSHEFPHLIEWAMNIFSDFEFGGRHSPSAGFAQSIEMPVLLPEEKLEVGLEMKYQSGSQELRGFRSTRGLQGGPTLAWRPTRNIRFDVSPLFGFSEHAPAVQVFGVFSVSADVMRATKVLRQERNWRSGDAGISACSVKVLRLRKKRVAMNITVM